MKLSDFEILLVLQNLKMAARRPTKIQLAKLEAQWQLGEYLGMFSLVEKILGSDWIILLFQRLVVVVR